MKRISLAAVLAGLAFAVPAQAHASTAVATYQGGSGNFNTTSNGTDGLRQVSGSLTASQTGNGTITISGSVSGLAPSTPYVAVPYKDNRCIPTPGITAFPSGSFLSDANGNGTPSGVTVNPQAINPAGSFNVSQTRSFSIRQAVISAIALPGIPIGTPTVPNAVQPEACDRAPVVAA